jgi:Fe-S-cluster containining protein
MTHPFIKIFERCYHNTFPMIHHSTGEIEVWPNCHYKEIMDSYLKERSSAFNEGSTFSCPDSCERYGCKELDLHITISLVDLVAISMTSGRRASDLFKDHCKLGFDPLDEKEPWIGRVTVELRKPCSFLDGKKCGVYAGRPVACALFPEAFSIIEEGQTALQKDIFRKFPCIRNRVPVSPERAKVLQQLMQMSGREMFLSDFYLFGISPLIIDLKNVAGEGLEGLDVSAGESVKLPHSRLERLLEKRLPGGETLDEWQIKIGQLDTLAGIEAFWKMKPWVDQLVAMGSNLISLAHQFDGSRLRQLRFRR